MTEENESYLYLDRDDYEAIHGYLTRWASADGEPVPPFASAKHADLEALVNAPRRSFFGMNAYPTLAEKAAIIFYTINKNQIFLNGNKRMSTLVLLVFLGINGKMLDVKPDELTAKALWLANTDSLSFPVVKGALVSWIGEHLQAADAEARTVGES